MGLQIEDGKGSGIRAGITSQNRLEVQSESNTQIHFSSLLDGLAFSWHSEDDDAAAGDFIMYIKNTSTTKLLVIDDIVCGTENASTLKLHRVTGTASGSSITGSNLNFQSGNTADATAIGSGAVSGLTSSSIIETIRLSANSTEKFTVRDALILGTGDAIAIEYDTGTTGDGEITVIGYFQ
jgi:hypothetical protein